MGLNLAAVAFLLLTLALGTGATPSHSGPFQDAPPQTGFGRAGEIPKPFWYRNLFRNPTHTARLPVKPQAILPGDCARVAEALGAAGWPKALVPVMVGVAKAESGCTPGATNISRREHSVGPFQINLKAHPRVTERCAREPRCAAKAALGIYQSQGLRAWTTFRNGTHMRFLGVAPK